MQKKQLTRQSTVTESRVPTVPQQERKQPRQGPSLGQAQQLKALSEAMQQASAQRSQETDVSNENPQIILPSSTKKNVSMEEDEQEKGGKSVSDERKTLDKSEDMGDTGDKESDDSHYMDDLLEADERTTVFNNSERRRNIEAKLRPLRPEDLDDHFEYRQVVQTENLSFCFRSPSHGEMEEIYRWISMEATSGLHGVIRLSSMLACAGTVSIAGKELPRHLDDRGRIDRDLFDEKYEKFSRFPAVVVEDCRVQFVWFDKRLAKMLSGGTLGNG